VRERNEWSNKNCSSKVLVPGVKCVPTCHMHMCRVGQNHIYTVFIRYFWQGNHQIHGHIRCIYTVLANPIHLTTKTSVCALESISICFLGCNSLPFLFLSLLAYICSTVQFGYLAILMCDAYSEIIWLNLFAPGLP